MSRTTFWITIGLAALNAGLVIGNAVLLDNNLATQKQNLATEKQNLAITEALPPHRCGVVILPHEHCDVTIFKFEIPRDAANDTY